MVCHAPLRGIRSLFSRLRGVVPDQTNPQFCNMCADKDYPPRDTEISVLFCDIRNYTAIAENTEPAIVAKLLNDYFTRVSSLIINNHGYVEKFVGDAVMCIFNAPIRLEHHAAVALETALQIRHTVESLQHAGIGVGIGVSSGTARVGKLGSTEAGAFGAVGDCVNVAARLQSQAAGGEIVMTREVYEAAKDVIPPELPVRKTDLDAKGKSEPISAVVVG